METWTARYRIVTPLALGGANHGAELRLASIKGVLRFWWRALAYTRYRPADGAANPEASRLNRIKLFEALLLGSADPRIGRSAVRLTWQEPPLAATSAIDLRGSGIGYLGYGLGAQTEKLDDATVVRREARTQVGRDQTFAIRLDVEDRPASFSDDEWKRASGDLRAGFETAKRTLADAVALLGLVGGLGARSRRGFGSLQIEMFERKGSTTSFAFASIDQYLKRIATLVGDDGQADDDSSELPPYTAFSRRARIVALCSHQNPMVALNHAGFCLQYCRSSGYWDKKTDSRWVHYSGTSAGHHGAGRRLPPSRLDHIAGDHKQYVRAIGATEGTAILAPARAIFGLPQNYKPWLSVVGAERNRRASPILLHVHAIDPTGSNRKVVFAVFLPATFLDGAIAWKRKIAGTKETTAFLTPPCSSSPDYGLIDTFIDTFEHAGGTFFVAPLEQLGLVPSGLEAANGAATFFDRGPSSDSAG